ncbi:iron-containing alcohol dehydrogenase, partial [Sulfurimonas sp.]|uniref:iron-containing alcohol dehydrogenase n=1 Tax=Sulfurimonas sp. TaxID=2022749 RepID=UPI003569ED46
MNDFMYHNPTKIEFGRAKENNIGQYIKETNIESVLLVYGTGSIKKNGLYERVIASLKNSGISYEELDGVVSNPLLSRVNDGIKIVKDKNIQAVLGVGGGSVADSA